jgi:hypothetical protein
MTVAAASIDAIASDGVRRDVIAAREWGGHLCMSNSHSNILSAMIVVVSKEPLFLAPFAKRMTQFPTGRQTTYVATLVSNTHK